MGYWCGGRDQHRSHVAALECRDVEPVAVDVDRDPFQAGRGDGRSQVGAAGLLDGDPPHAARGQRPAREREPLGQARGHHDRRGVGGDAAHPAEVRGERAAQLGGSARVAVAQARVGRVAQSLAQRRGPRGAREERDVGRAGAEVEARRTGLRCRRGRRLSGGARGHPRGGALARHEIALGRELRVGLHDDPAGDAQLACQRARGRQRRLVAQRARADALAQLVLELRAQPDRGVAVEAHHQVDAGTGLHLRVPTGPRQ